MTQCQIEFEKYVTDDGKWPRAAEKDRNGDYKFIQSHNDWTTWQAAWRVARETV